MVYPTRHRPKTVKRTQVFWIFNFFPFFYISLSGIKKKLYLGLSFTFYLFLLHKKSSSTDGSPMCREQKKKTPAPWPPVFWFLPFFRHSRLSHVALLPHLALAFSLPILASPCVAFPYLAYPCVAFPCLTFALTLLVLPCLRLDSPCLALPHLESLWIFAEKMENGKNLSIR